MVFQANLAVCEFISASDKDLELEPRPPVTLKSSGLEDIYDVHGEIGK